MSQNIGQHGLPDADARFDFTAFFAGKTTAWGIFEDRFGKLRRHFRVQMQGQWVGDVFQLDELFVYDTGETEARQWLVTPVRDGNFTATCPDCVGQAVGQCNEQTIQMRYRFRLVIGGRTTVVSVNDRIHTIGGDLAVNRATMRKFGIRLGELSLFFRREPN